MGEYVQINLSNILEQIGEDGTKSILSDFSCPQNKDVEFFLHNKAIEFAKHGSFDEDLKKYIIPAVLIGQLGKNYAENNNQYISGDELLQMALDKIRYIQSVAGGKYVYLECEEKPQLLSFYKRNGFRPCGKRALDGDETNLHGKYLIQLLKYL